MTGSGWPCPVRREIIGNGEGEVAGNTLKRTIPVPELFVNIRRVGQAGEPAGVLRLLNPDKLPGVAKRQRPQEDPIHHAEYRDIGADSQAEHEYSDQGKTAIAPQRTEGVAQILHHAVQPRQPARFAMFFAGLLDASEANQRLPPGLFGCKAAPNVFFDGEF